jgi:hypothetical protein
MERDRDGHVTVPRNREAAHAGRRRGSAMAGAVDSHVHG